MDGQFRELDIDHYLNNVLSSLPLQWQRYLAVQFALRALPVWEALVPLTFANSVALRQAIESTVYWMKYPPAEKAYLRDAKRAIAVAENTVARRPAEEAAQSVAYAVSTQEGLRANAYSLPVAFSPLQDAYHAQNAIAWHSTNPDVS